jgi:RNA polymerase sigma-70 factor (ECF subfamily)
VLRAKIDQPQLRSAELAQHVGILLGRTFTEVGIRQMVHRARQRFAELLVAEVAATLPASGSQQLEEELIELGLLDYCRPALPRGHRLA